MSLDLPLEVHDLLQISTMTLATCDRDGVPHAAAVYFAADLNQQLYFFSEVTSQHGLDLESNPLAAVSIYPECSNWREIHGLQIRGTVRSALDGAEWEAGWAIYAHKFPFVRDLRFIVQRNQMYLLKPSWLRLVDNRRGFGFKQEWQIR